MCEKKNLKWHSTGVAQTRVDYTFLDLRSHPAIFWKHANRLHGIECTSNEDLQSLNIYELYLLHAAVWDKQNGLKDLRVSYSSIELKSVVQKNQKARTVSSYNIAYPRWCMDLSFVNHFTYSKLFLPYCATIESLIVFVCIRPQPHLSENTCRQLSVSRYMPRTQLFLTQSVDQVV